ncbi:hypothetical protein GCM10010872_31860 [Dyella flava]|nr:hypothetical protein GCM10010872_31860 [Dyella flava]
MVAASAGGGALAGFTPGSFMPGGGGAGAKCGMADEDDEVCAKAGEAARTAKAYRQTAYFMSKTSLGV